MKWVIACRSANFLEVEALLTFMCKRKAQQSDAERRGAQGYISMGRPIATGLGALTHYAGCVTMNQSCTNAASVAKFVG